MSASAGLVPRRIAAALDAAMAVSPVVAITGARTAGKSTLAGQITGRAGGTFIDLDDPAVRRLAITDPTAFVRDLAEPIVIDEFQRAPDLLAAIKSELNRDWRPGRFVLTGSARHEAVPELADFLTGRVELLRLWPFAMAELEPAAPSIVELARRRRAAAADLGDESRRAGRGRVTRRIPDRSRVATRCTAAVVQQPRDTGHRTDL